MEVPPESIVRRMYPEVELRGPEDLAQLELVLEDLSSMRFLLQFGGLVTLRLVNCNLQKIQGLQRCLQLQQLYLSQNLIASLAGLPSLPKLKLLVLNHNCIRNFAGLDSLPKLESLQLCANKFDSLAGVNKLASLKRLWLASNSIKKIGCALCYSMGLEELQLSGNEISEAGEVLALGFTPGLKSLGLAHRLFGPNPICCPGLKESILWILPSLRSYDGVALSEAERQESAMAVSRKEHLLKLRHKKTRSASAKLLSYVEHYANSELPRLRNLIYADCESRLSYLEIERRSLHRTRLQNVDWHSRHQRIANKLIRQAVCSKYLKDNFISNVVLRQLTLVKHSASGWPGLSSRLLLHVPEQQQQSIQAQLQPHPMRVLTNRLCEMVAPGLPAHPLRKLLVFQAYSIENDPIEPFFVPSQPVQILLQNETVPKEGALLRRSLQDDSHVLVFSSDAYCRPVYLVELEFSTRQLSQSGEGQLAGHIESITIEMQFYGLQEQLRHYGQLEEQLDQPTEFEQAQTFLGLVSVPACKGTTVRSLNLSNNKLVSLLGIEAFSSLQVLSVRFNLIAEPTEVERLACLSLTELDLTGNPIFYHSACVPQWIISTLPTLTRLNGLNVGLWSYYQPQNSQLVSSSNYFVQKKNSLLKSVQHIPKFVLQLDLSNNFLTEVRALSGCQFLRRLNISNNFIAALPVSPPALLHLSAESNLLTGFAALGSAPQLQFLFLSNNCISQLNYDLSPLVLDLRNNPLQTTRGRLLLHYPQLQILNGLKVAEAERSSRESLSLCSLRERYQRLKLDQLSLKNALQLPCKVINESRFTGLKRLDLSRNKLASIAMVGWLPQLQALFLQHNQLEYLCTEVGSGLHACSALSQLNVSSNRLSRLSELRLFSLPKLRVLRADQNKFSWVEGVKHLQLSVLSLARNSIVEVGRCSLCSSLSLLDLSQNPLAQLSGLCELEPSAKVVAEGVVLSQQNKRILQAFSKA